MILFVSYLRNLGPDHRQLVSAPADSGASSAQVKRGNAEERLHCSTESSSCHKNRSRSNSLSPPMISGVVSTYYFQLSPIRQTES